MLDRDKDTKDPRRPLGSDVVENSYYRVTTDKATGRITIFDKQLDRDIVTGLEIVGVEECGTNNVQKEIETGRNIPLSVEDKALEQNTPVSTVFKITGNVTGIPVVQKIILYQSLKRVEIENSLDWNQPRFLNIELLIPIPHTAAINYGVPFGVASRKDVLPGSGPRAEDEIQKDSWQKYRAIQSWYQPAPTTGNSL